MLWVNARHPKAWALRAVMAHVGGDRKKEEAHRKEALSTWSTNPEVDHVLGLKLSQKYRFAEGAWYQGQALKFNADYVAAKIQLAQDLLRLGKEDQGWQLADEVFKADQYNVVAFNLATLHDNISKFRTLQNEHFIVRLHTRNEQCNVQRSRSRRSGDTMRGANVARHTLLELLDEWTNRRHPTRVETFFDVTPFIAAQLGHAQRNAARGHRRAGLK